MGTTFSLTKMEHQLIELVFQAHSVQLGMIHLETVLHGQNFSIHSIRARETIKSHCKSLLRFTIYTTAQMKVYHRCLTGSMKTTMIKLQCLSLRKHGNTSLVGIANCFMEMKVVMVEMVTTMARTITVPTVPMMTKVTTEKTTGPMVMMITMMKMVITEKTTGPMVMMITMMKMATMEKMTGPMVMMKVTMVKMTGPTVMMIIMTTMMKVAMEKMTGPMVMMITMIMMTKETMEMTMIMVKMSMGTTSIGMTSIGKIMVTMEMIRTGMTMVTTGMMILIGTIMITDYLVI